MSRSQFWKLFWARDLDGAVQTLEGMDAEEKRAIFLELFQRAGYSRPPHSISVLFRELHEGKSFEDFYRAWFPADEHTQTEEIAGQTFEQFFPAPIRVINGINLRDPKEVVSVGLHWITDEEFAQIVELTQEPKNRERGERIAEVAEKAKAEVYKVERDDNLGTPF